jgi:DNA-binding transcriptional MocR family regulator
VSRPGRKLDPAQYVGIHDRVSDYVAKCEIYPLVTNLAGTYGPPEIYPAQELKNAAIRALRKHPMLLSSPPDFLNDSPLNAVLAKRALEAGMQLAPEDILVTNGCIEAINIALRAVAQPGDTVAVESPTYHGLLQILESLGLRALEIPTSPTQGISVEALDLAFQTHDRIRAVVVIPNFHNPLSCVMPDSEKEKLVRLCERQQVALIEDDTYAAMGPDDIPLKAAKAWDRSGSVIHCASLRKTLAPGMRLGWIAGGRWQARIRCSSTRKAASLKPCLSSPWPSSWPPARMTGTWPGCAACSRCSASKWPMRSHRTFRPAPGCRCPAAACCCG